MPNLCYMQSGIIKELSWTYWKMLFDELWIQNI